MRMNYLKKLLCTMVICAAFVGMAMTSFGQIPPMVAHWPLDDATGTVVTDVVGGYHGTMVGLDPGAAWIAGKHGGAVRFDNVGGHHIEVPHAAALDFGNVDFSISMLVRYTVFPVDADRWIQKGTHGGQGVETGNRYEFYIHDDDSVRFAIDNEAIDKSLCQVAHPFATTDWVHMVAVRDTSVPEMRVYADGVLLGSAADISGDISNGEMLVIGDVPRSDSPMSGDIDDVRIFALALTVPQIEAIRDWVGATPTPTEIPEASVQQHWTLFD